MVGSLYCHFVFETCFAICSYAVSYRKLLCAIRVVLDKMFILIIVRLFGNVVGCFIALYAIHTTLIIYLAFRLTRGR